MQVHNSTPFEFVYFPSRLDYPGHSLTVVVKGTFSLVPDGRAVVAEEQLPVGPDIPHPDAEDDNGSVYYDSDLVEYKPEADLLLVGTCYPAGGSTRKCKVGFRVGDRARTLNVVGDREWQIKGLLRKVTVTDPMPFDSMPLRYELAFGGDGDPRNPVGKGAGPVETAGGSKLHALPNIEDPDDLVTSPKARPEPAGFGPLNRLWRQRTSGMGTYDEAYVEKRFPWVPEDFDWASCNAAPTKLRVKRYLKGDEDLEFRNLHPEHATYVSELPGTRVRCFLHESPGADRRGDDRTVPLGSGNLMRELPMKLDTLWVDSEQEQLVLVWRGSAAVSSNEFEEVLDLVIGSEPVERQEQAVEHYCGLLKERIAQPVVQPVEQADETVEQAVAAAPVTWTREEVERALAEGTSLVGGDLSSLNLSGLSMAGVDLEGARLNGAVLDGVDLGGANLTAADLTGASLRGVSAKGASFEGAQLSGACLADGKFDQAVFDRATIDQADFRQASLVEASLAGATGGGADFSKADLEGLRSCEGACLIGARFVQVHAPGSSWAEALLGRADFSYADLTRADFTKANLGGATLDAADLREAVFYRADLTDALMTEANLFNGIFEQADVSGADLGGANLYGAYFVDARTKGVRAKNADVKHATGFRP